VFTGENMDELLVDFDALIGARAAIERSIEDTTAVLDDLTRQVRHWAAVWTGTAADNCRGVIADWLAAQQDPRRPDDPGAHAARNQWNADAAAKPAGGTHCYEILACSSRRAVNYLLSHIS
jgi:hypothetical protein